MKNYLLLLIALGSFAFVSCEKDEDHDDHDGHDHSGLVVESSASFAQGLNIIYYLIKFQALLNVDWVRPKLFVNQKINHEILLTKKYFKNAFDGFTICLFMQQR